MPCDHRFINELIPDRSNIQYLFIGTFNPSWNRDEEDDATYFYGRGGNFFWCILPHAFNENCLIDKGKDEWTAFCQSINHQICVTDLVCSVLNAEKDQHHEILTGYSDAALDQKNADKEYVFELAFSTEQLKKLIDRNVESLQGVFFTRSSRSGITRIWKQWKMIKDHCSSKKDGGKSIVTAELLTPSLQGTEGGIRRTIEQWRQAITCCNS